MEMIENGLFSENAIGKKSFKDDIFFQLCFAGLPSFCGLCSIQLDGRLCNANINWNDIWTFANNRRNYINLRRCALQRVPENENTEEIGKDPSKIALYMKILNENRRRSLCNGR